MDNTISSSASSTTPPTLERRLGGALEPVIGQVYFSPEAHAEYVRLGFSPSPGDVGGVAMPEGISYQTSRGSVMGQVRGEVVAAAFAVFNPVHIVQGVTKGWTITNAETVCNARDTGALGQLDRILGVDAAGLERVEELLVRATNELLVAGRPMAAGISALPDPDHRFGTIFRRGDLLREFRGDSHTAAWINAGLDAVQIGLLTELFWGIPLRSYTRTRGWTDEQFDQAEEALRSRGLLTNEGTFTPAGRELREQIERDTDSQMAPVMKALGNDAEELVELLIPWGASIRSQHGYLTSGPHDLASAASGNADR